METVELGVEARSKSGKGAARAMRRGQQVPAVLYGAKRESVSVALDRKEFEAKVGAITGTHLIRLASAAAGLGGRLVLVKEVQRHPVNHEVLHADLYEVDVNVKIRLRVPLQFLGRAAGVDLGGILQPIRREVEVLCLPTQIPELLEVDVAALGIHDSLHLSDLKPPPGVEIPFDADEAVVSVLPPVVEEVKVAAGGEAAEGGAAPVESAKPEAGKGAS